MKRPLAGVESRTLTDVEGRPAALFDFGGLVRVSGDGLQSVREVHGNFLRRLGASLAVALRCTIVGEIFEVEQTTYGSFADALSNHSCMAFLNSPGKGMCALNMESELSFAILDRLMGGEGYLAVTDQRELTEVETCLLETPLAIIARSLTEAWSSRVCGEFTLRSIRTSPRSQALMARSDALVVVGMRMRFGETEGAVRLGLPAALMKSLEKEDPDTAGSTASTRSPETESEIRRRLSSELSLDVDFELQGSSIRLSDLSALRPGSVVDLGVHCDGAITLSINRVPKLRGWLTQVESKMAVTIG